MFKLTRNNLQGKTDAQLTALFQEVSKGKADRPDLASARSLVSMIRAEIACRLNRS
jgi:hypothetical protein